MIIAIAAILTVIVPASTAANPLSRKSRQQALRALPVIAAFIVAGLLASASAQAQFFQEAKLVGTGAITGPLGGAQQGSSVSLSADGNTAIVGGPFDANTGFPVGVGAAWVFIRAGETWTQQAKLVGKGAVGPSAQGLSVSLSADGNIAAVGGFDDNNLVGAAWVFTRSRGVWTQQAKLVGTGAIGLAGQGRSVSLSADGNTLIVGGFYDNDSVGAAWVFTRSDGAWTQQAKLVGTGAISDQLGVAQGISVALSGNGNAAIVGGDSDNDGAGAAWVFTRSRGEWTQQAKLVGTGAIGNAEQGLSVSLSSDGTLPSSVGLSTAMVQALLGCSHAWAGCGPSRRN